MAMKRHKIYIRLAGMLACALALGCAVGCGGAASDVAAPATDGAAEVAAEASALADGTYAIEVDTDSSMFHSESCLLTVEGDTYTASLTLPGEGFSRLYFGSAAEAAEASDDEIYDYYLNDDGKYTFDIPVAALDEELPIAAFGHRRDTWYDHTITFCSPATSDAEGA